MSDFQYDADDMQRDGLIAEVNRLRLENLSLYRELLKPSAVSPETQRLQKILDGVAVPGQCILTGAADEIERLRSVARELYQLLTEYNYTVSQQVLQDYPWLEEKR